MPGKNIKSHFTGWGFLILFCVFPHCCLAQAQAVPWRYDFRKMRLLLQTSATYIFAANQGKIDMDSAVIFASKLEHVSEALAFNADYYYGGVLPGADLIEKSNIDAAIRLAERSTGRKRVLVLLQLGAWYLHRTGNRQEDLRNAFGFLASARIESRKIKDFKLFAAADDLLGDLAVQAGKEKESRAYFLEIADSCEANGDTETLANTLNHEASSLSDGDSLKIQLFKRCEALFDRLKEPERKIEVIEELSVVYFDRGLLKQVRDLELQMIAQETAIGFRHVHYSYNALTFIDLITGNLKDAIIEANTGVDIMEETGDSLVSVYFYLQQAQVYSNIGKTEECLAIFEKVLRQYRGGPMIWYNLFIASAGALMTEGRNQEALNLIQRITARYPPPSLLEKLKVVQQTAFSLQRLGNIEEASKYWDELSTIAGEITKPEMEKDLAQAYVLLSNFYIQTRKYDLASMYIEKAEKINPGKLDYFTKVFIPLCQYKIDSARKNYRQSLLDYQRYSAWHDSANGSTKIREYNILLLQMEKEKKEKDIELLNSETKIQAIWLARAKVLRNITFIGIALLIVVILVIYKLYRKNRLNAREISRKNQSLEHFLDEKEYLLKEVHHRVKNNLQIINSLLESQSTLQQQDPLFTLHSLRHRVYAMSLIHQKLYNFDNPEKLNIKEYINELVAHLQDCFDTSSHISFLLDLLPVPLDISQAIPIGLIISEAITNSVKYAFPGGRIGVISIKMVLFDGNHLKLMISDNGIGLPADFGASRKQSLGIKLIRGLSADMDAKLVIENQGGTHITLDFNISATYTGDKYVSLT